MLGFVISQQISVIREGVELLVSGNLAPERDHGRRLPLTFEPNCCSRIASTEKLYKFRGFGLMLRILGNPYVPTACAAGRLSFLEIGNRCDLKVDSCFLEPPDIPFTTYKNRDFACGTALRGHGVDGVIVILPTI